MLLTQEDRIKLNYFANGDGEAALEYLAERIWDYYSKETVYSDANDILRNQGAARLAEWIKKLPKGLRNGPTNNTPTN